MRFFNKSDNQQGDTNKRAGRASQDDDASKRPNSSNQDAQPQKDSAPYRPQSYFASSLRPINLPQSPAFIPREGLNEENRQPQNQEIAEDRQLPPEERVNREVTNDGCATPKKHSFSLDKGGGSGDKRGNGDATLPPDSAKVADDN